MRLTDEDYLDYVRRQVCCVPGCNCRPCQAHHRIGHGRRQDYANKVSDYEAISLCEKHHDELHRHGWQTFEAKYGINQLKECIKSLVNYLNYWKALQGAPF